MDGQQYFQTGHCRIAWVALGGAVDNGGVDLVSPRPRKDPLIGSVGRRRQVQLCPWRDGRRYQDAGLLLRDAHKNDNIRFEAS